MNFSEGIKRAIEALREKKAEDLVLIDLRGICSFTDYFIIATSSSTRHSQTLSEYIQERVGIKPLGIEGEDRGEWVLVDYGDFIVHIFLEEKRNYYSLETLWMDGKFYNFNNETDSKG